MPLAMLCALQGPQAAWAEMGGGSRTSSEGHHPEGSNKQKADDKSDRECLILPPSCFIGKSAGAGPSRVHDVTQ